MRCLILAAFSVCLVVMATASESSNGPNCPDGWMPTCGRCLCEATADNPAQFCRGIGGTPARGTCYVDNPEGAGGHIQQRFGFGNWQPVGPPPRG